MTTSHLHLHICTSTSSPHLHIYISTSSHLHIYMNLCSSSHLHIYMNLCSSSHLHIYIFTSAHLHLCSSSHLHIYISAHLHICTSHICGSSRSSFNSFLRRGCGAAGAPRKPTLCGDRACRRREMRVRSRFCPVQRNPLRRSCVSKARNAGEIAFWIWHGQPSAEIVRTEGAKCR